MTIRPAAPDDLDAVVELYRARAKEAASYRAAWGDADARPEPVEESVSADMTRPDSAVLVADDGGRVTGYAVVTVGPGLPQHTDLHARISDFHVDDGFRDAGLEDELFSAAVAWAREQGAKTAEIGVVAGDRHAKGVFERLGLKARIVRMHKDLA